MAQLLVRNVPDALAKSLKQRAARHGVSAEEEHRRILSAALEEVPTVATEAGERPRTLFEAFFELGRIAPDFEFERDRKSGNGNRSEF